MEQTKKYVNFSQLRLEALDRLPEDFPNLKAMKNIWKMNKDDFTLTNKKYLEKCRKECDEDIERYLERYHAK